MATYLQTYNIAHDVDFRKRVQTAVLIAARDILNEPVPPDDPDKVGPRYQLARQATRLDDPALDRFAWECALNPTIAAAEATDPGSSADVDLNFVVVSAWGSVA